MKALIFAAGFGTRLKPLTNNTPKALVKVNGKPMLQNLLEQLKTCGITDFVINTHHFSEQIIRFLKANNNFNCNILISDESQKLLDTGGGLKKVEHFFKNTPYFLVHNVDIYTQISIHELKAAHRLNQDALATLAVQERHSSRKFGFDEKGQLCAWKNFKTKEEIISKPNTKTINYLAFSGIHIISNKLFELLPPEDKYSITPEYLRLSAKHKIMAYEHCEPVFDLGTPQRIAEAEAYLKL